MSTKNSPRTMRKRLRQSTLSPLSAAAAPSSTPPSRDGTVDSKRRRRSSGGSSGGAAGSTEARGVWDTTSRGVMTFEPAIWRTDDYALLRSTPDQLKVAAFDLDSTLISTRSRAKFPKSPSDWRPLNARVAPSLVSLRDAGYIFVIFTNQAGVGNGRVTPDFIRTRLDAVCSSLDIHAGVYVATAKDHFRKPATAMWDSFVQLIGGVHRIDPAASFYVGDAAGRLARPGASKDYSDSDLRFAVNIGLQFRTPEHHFYDREADAVRTDLVAGFDPRVLVSQHATPLLDETTDVDAVLREIVSPPSIVQQIALGAIGTSGGDGGGVQMMVLMHGSPASGKTSFVKRHLTPKGFVWINQDTLHTFSRCGRALRDALAEGSSVVVDNTNADQKGRAKYIEMAKQHGAPVKVVCLCMGTDDALARHLNIVRERETQGGCPRVPVVAFHAYNKRVEAPSSEEGIDCIGAVAFVPRFNNEQERYMFTRLT